jgi:hypothetical protein
MMRITESVTSRMFRLRNFDLAVKRPLIAVEPLNGQTPMAASIKFLPGATIRWHGRRYVIVDYAGLGAIRFAKVDRPEESCRLRKRLRPRADHNRLCNIPKWAVFRS